MIELIRWLGEQLDEDERIARDASGGTVEGEPGRWKAAPGGDEWEASRTDCDEDELLVALRPGLPRPPDVMSGLWGQIVAFKPEFEDRRVSSPLPQLVHAARHDPARVLREIDAKRDLLRFANGIHDHHETFTTGIAARLEKVLRLYALAYVERPGYRQEWKP